jgi:hypothetical protein
MPKRRVLKKDLTPIGRKGSVDVRAGKGSNMQRTAPGQRESVTGGSPFDRASEVYPKPPPPAPAGMGPQPTALMPGGLPDEFA